LPDRIIVLKMFDPEVIKMEIEFGNGKNMLYRYIDDANKNWDHPDPLFEELTYGEGGGGNFGTMVRNNVRKDSHIFFHATIEGQRYITAHFCVSKIVEGYDARHDAKIRRDYINPHIHPENYPEWEPNYDVDKEIRGNRDDILIFGDSEKSLGKLVNPLKFDRGLAEKLKFEENKQITFEKVDKNGKIITDSGRITSCTRVPRYITEEDVKFLIEKIGISDDAKKIVKPEQPDIVHVTKDLIEKSLKELGKMKASKDELLIKLKEIVEREGNSLIDDETAWNDILKLNYEYDE
jgi:hypothetical protein